LRDSILYYYFSNFPGEAMKSNLKILLLFSGIMIILAVHCITVYGQDSKTGTEEKKGDEILLKDVQMAEDYRASQGRGSGTGFNYWANFITALVIVVVFIWLLGFMLKYLFAKLPGFHGRDEFRVINSIKMTAQSSLFIVRFIDEIYILAVTPQNACLINRIDDPARVKEILDSMTEAAPGVNPHAFGTRLQRKLSQIIQSEKNDTRKQNIESDRDTFKDTLSRLKNYDDDEKKKDRDWKA
jgi:flagellar biogenesis protein FliO